MKGRISLLSVICIGYVCIQCSGEAWGAKIEDVFKGKIIVMTKRPPERFSNASAFAKFLQANRKQILWPDKKEKNEWRFEFMAFFARPLDDLEVNVKFYDVTEGKKFVAADNFYTPARGQRIFSSNMVLNKPRFSVDRKYMMALTNAQGVIISSTTFWLRGEKTRYSGKVTFTDEDTRVKDD